MNFAKNIRIAARQYCTQMYRKYPSRIVNITGIREIVLGDGYIAMDNGMTLGFYSSLDAKTEYKILSEIAMHNIQGIEYPHAKRVGNSLITESDVSWLKNNWSI